MKKGLVWFMIAIFSLVLATPSALGQAEEGENLAEVENIVFRDIKVKGKNGDYVIDGEARTKNGTFYYLVEDGHYEFISETKITMKERQQKQKWASFNIKISIPKNKLPDNGTVAIYFYEKDQNNNMIHVQATVLEQF